MCSRRLSAASLRSTIFTRVAPDEPNLDEPGKPMIVWVEHEDGSRSPIESAQTKRDNYIDLATACGSEEAVTPEACEAAGLDWREWCYFVLEMHDEQAFMDEHMLAYETNYEAMHGVPAPGMAKLRARMRKDRLGLSHLDEPEPADD